MGYLPEALLNFLALLANAAREGEDEIMDLSAIVRRFEVEHVPIGGPVFDFAKLDWLNGRYLRERLDPESFARRAREWAITPERLARMAELAAPRVERLSDLGPLLAFLFSGRLALRAEDFRGVKLDETEMRRAFEMALEEFDALPAWNAFGVETAIKSVAERARKESPRRRAPVLRRDHGKSDVDPALRLDGAARTRSGARAAARRTRAAQAATGDGMIRAVVLAAGKGTRMKSARSKVLHEICGRPMLWYVIRALRDAGVGEILVVVNAELEDEIASFGVAGVLQAEQLGTGDAVEVALDRLEPHEGGRIVVACGDMPLVTHQLLRGTIETLDAADAQGAAMALVTVKMPLPSNFGRIVRRGTSVERIVEVRDATPAELEIDEMNAGIYAFDEASLRDAVTRLQPDNAQAEYYLTDTVADFVNSGRRVAPVVATDHLEVLGINDRVELARARREMNARICAQHMRDGVTIIDPQATYLEPELEIGNDTVIYPNTTISRLSRIGKTCTIGPNARLSNARLGDRVTLRESVVIDSEAGSDVTIGPFAHLRGETVLADRVHVGNFVEIKKSKLAPGVKVSHLSYLGDATVGEDTNVGAGTITCNYDGTKKNPTRIGRRVSIGSNTSLVAPVTVGDDALTGAGSVVTKDVPEGERVAGNPARPLPKK